MGLYLVPIIQGISKWSISANKLPEFLQYLMSILGVEMVEEFLKAAVWDKGIAAWASEQ